MGYSFDQILLIGGALLFVAVLASKLSGRLGLPSLLLFLVLGMLAGSEGLGGIEFTDVGLAQTVGVIALAFILFSGGLDTGWPSVRRVVWPSVLLASVGVVLTALPLAIFATLLLGVDFLYGMLLASIVASTDAAAVFAVMRSRGISLHEHLKRLLEFESGSNDPMAIFMTTGVIGLMMNPGSSVLGLFPQFLVQMTLGVILGLGLGWLIVWVINSINLGYDGLYTVLTIASVPTVYGLTAVLGGNGFLAVYLAGLMMGNRHFIHKRSLRRFHDGLGWLMQIAMFVVLGLLVFPSQLVPVAGVGILLALFLIFIARPLGVFITLLPFRMPLAEKTMISWVGLRGAVPVILATYPLVAGVPDADRLFHIIFFIVILSVLLQGPLIPVVARWLGLDEPLLRTPRYPIELEESAGLDSDLVEVPVPPDSPAVGRPIVELRLPDKALVILIAREDSFIVPRGGTVIENGDRLLILADDPSLEGVREILQAQS